MKIAFTGKGGSGKTTISSLFARIAASDGLSVLALDADINQHLAEAIGYVGQLRNMGIDTDVIKEYLRGGNELIDTGTMHKTTPPGRGSCLLSLSDDDWFISEFARKHEGVWMAGAGEIPAGNVGVRCYHGLNGTVELVLGHLIDRRDDMVIVDMTAGADAFSSSLFTKVDALVVVVEPTLKSLGVYEQFERHANDYGVPIIVIGNKIADDSDKNFIRERIKDVDAWVGVSSYVRQMERGVTGVGMENETVEALRRLRTLLLSKPVDWQKREELSHRMHRRAVKKPQIDVGFSLLRAANS